MSNYIIITNIVEDEPKSNFGKIKRVELTKTGSAMFVEIHDIIRKEYDNGFLMCFAHEAVNNRKKYNIASVMIFKNGVRMTMGFEHSIQYNKIKWVVTDVPEMNDWSCPHCGNDEIEFDGDRTFGSNEASQEVYCPVCECHWYNVYKFKEVQILN